MSYSKCLVFVLALVILEAVCGKSLIGNTYNNAYFPSAWTLQAELRVSEAGDTYGLSPVGMEGRGFITVISGYDRVHPGIYVHTNDDGNAARGVNVWSQQAKLVPADGGASQDEFGRWIVSKGHTILVSAPYQNTPLALDAGAVYVFNGTLRHWTQMQKLIAADAAAGDHFGELVSLNKNRAVISATGASGASFHFSSTMRTVGACYIYERKSGGVFWSRTAKLWAKDMYQGNYFSEHVGVFDDWVVSTARNDLDPGLNSGSAYMFKQTAGKWSQQQKLIAGDLYYWQPVRDVQRWEKDLGVKVFANDISLEGSVLAAGYRRTDKPEIISNGVYIFNGYSTSNRWSLQQKLFYDVDPVFNPNPQGEGTEFLMNSTKVKMFNTNNLVASVYGPNHVGYSYVFKSFGKGWSLQQAVKPVNVFTEVTGGPSEDFTGFVGSGTGPDAIAYENSTFEHPEMHGGMLFHKFRNTNLIHSRFHNGSCLLIWMSDHYLDGWDTLVLTVRAPDQSNDTFHPHCDQVDPFYVRYCPYQPEDEGVYIIKMFAPTKARYYWEASWQVQVEDTGLWYKGDYATKMRFNFNSTSMAFNFFDAENLVSLDRPCFRCVTVADKSWAELQNPGGDSFWPLDAWNAPFYISDYEGRAIVAMGNTCDNVNHYQCYERVKDGFYTLRLGGGLFGRLTGLPYTGAKWKGCGASGTDRDQLVFKISDNKCHPVQVFHFSNRCSRPPPIDRYHLSGLEAPTASGTVAPTVNVFGEPYVQYEMYAFDGAAQAAKAKQKVQAVQAKPNSILDAIKSAEVDVVVQESIALPDDETDEHIVPVGKLDAFF